MRRSLYGAFGLSLFLVACGADAEALPADEARQQLTDRNWIDVWPESKDEQLHVYRFTPSMGGGVFQDRTVFQGNFELFQFEASGEQIRFHFPGPEERVTTAYRIEPVDGPAPFTHRLVLEDDPRGPGTYYGWNEGQTASPFRQ
ncbi:MAG: hypothetical protein SangKO_057630 [Sandaracinaceae bacterium]